MYVKIISRDSLPISHPHGFRSDLKVDRAYNSKPRRMGNWKCGTCVRGRFIHCHCRSFRKGHCYRRMVKRENCPSLRLVFIARIRRCCNGTRGGRECLPCGYTHVHTHTRVLLRARNVAQGSRPPSSHCAVFLTYYSFRKSFRNVSNHGYAYMRVLNDARNWYSLEESLDPFHFMPAAFRNRWISSSCARASSPPFHFVIERMEWMPCFVERDASGKSNSCRVEENFLKRETRLRGLCLCFFSSFLFFLFFLFFFSFCSISFSIFSFSLFLLPVCVR